MRPVISNRRLLSVTPHSSCHLTDPESYYYFEALCSPGSICFAFGRCGHSHEFEARKTVEDNNRIIARRRSIVSPIHNWRRRSAVYHCKKVIATVLISRLRQAAHKRNSVVTFAFRLWSAPCLVGLTASFLLVDDLISRLASVRHLRLVF